MLNRSSSYQRSRFKRSCLFQLLFKYRSNHDGSESIAIFRELCGYSVWNYWIRDWYRRMVGYDFIGDNKFCFSDAIVPSVQYVSPSWALCRNLQWEKLDLDLFNNLFHEANLIRDEFKVRKEHFESKKKRN